MPIPKPEKGEKEDAFISRCMGDETMKTEYPDRDQRLAVCYDSWREKHGGDTPADLKNFKGVFIRSQVTEADIWIYEEIGSGWFGGISAKQFADELKALGKISHINLRINSPGGDVFDGIAIYNILKQNSAKVTAHIDGLAASIASIIAMAGDEIRMAANASLMIHKAWGMVIGNATDMASMASTLIKLDGQIAGTYAKRTGKPFDEINQMMSDETWMNSAEALDYGFVDQVTEEMKLAACFDLDKFKFKKNPLAERGPMPPEPALQDKGGPMPPDVSIYDDFLNKRN